MPERMIKRTFDVVDNKGNNVIQTFLIEISGADLFVQAHSCKMKKIIGIKSNFQGRNR